MREDYAIEPLEGWSWDRFTDDLAAWADIMEEMKSKASTELRPLVKRIMAATVASFGSTGYKTVVTAKDFDPETDQPIGAIGTGLTGLYSRWHESNRTNMLHWYSYILMSQRLAVWEAAEPYQERKKLLRIAADCVRVRPPALWVPEGFRVKGYAI